MSLPWKPDSWQGKIAQQQPVYEDRTSLQKAVTTIGDLPPLVTSWEVEKLKADLAEVSQGKAFLLQGGDCAESLSLCNPQTITAKIKILLQMSLVLVHGVRKPIVRVGRIAGQFAKPRSSDTEVRDSVELPSYRGDIVNSPEFSLESRRADPQRMIDAYQKSAMTINFVRALVTGGFADLHHPEYWDLDFVEHSKHAEEYKRLVTSIQDSVDFMSSVAGIALSDLRKVAIYTSHEGLLLPYEQAQTRQVPHHTGWYNLTTHFPWIGKRTADIDGAHVEYFRGIRNPIGIKLGPGVEAEQVIRLLDVLDPNNEPGRITLIHRFGAKQVEQLLPPLITRLQKTNRQVVWSCDPMHGNTEMTSSGYKTRRFDNILHELERSFAIHHDLGSYLGGVHFELTGENVTECIGGARGLEETDLQRAYTSLVDPRLNCEQALEMAMSIAKYMRQMP